VVGQVTEFQAGWTEGQRGALVQLLDRNESAFFDMERKVLIFGHSSYLIESLGPAPETLSRL
jgi:hypothetical protein